MKQDRAALRAQLKIQFKKICKEQPKYKSLTFSQFFAAMLVQTKTQKKLEAVKNRVLTEQQTEELAEFFTDEAPSTDIASNEDSKAE